jgi:hypothetical protein
LSNRPWDNTLSWCNVIYTIFSPPRNSLRSRVSNEVYYRYFKYRRPRIKQKKRKPNPDQERAKKKKWKKRENIVTQKRCLTHHIANTFQNYTFSWNKKYTLLTCMTLEIYSCQLEWCFFPLEIFLFIHYSTTWDCVNEEKEFKYNNISLNTFPLPFL